MKKVKKIKNSEVYKFSQNFTIKTLSNCKLFREVFGENFAKSKILLNYKICYTNEESETVDGYYNHQDLSINLCQSRNNENILTVDEIKKDQNMLATILHESVHACLWRQEKRKFFKKIDGTGIYEKCNNNGKISELGEGLNEGYTNWVCGKAGYECDGYVEPTTIVKELEIAIGERNTMALGKGGIESGEIPKLLDMKKEDAIGLIAQCDFICKTARLTLEINLIEDKIEKLKDESLRDDEDAKESIMEKLMQINVYAQLDKNEFYNEYLQKNEEQDSIDNRLKFLEEMKEKSNKSIHTTKTQIDEMIFEKYLLKDFEQIKSEEIIR